MFKFLCVCVCVCVSCVCRQELLNTRDELERQREQLAVELATAEEEKISCLRETEQARGALINADHRCREVEVEKQLLEGQVSVLCVCVHITYTHMYSNIVIELCLYK